MKNVAVEITVSAEDLDSMLVSMLETEASKYWARFETFTLSNDDETYLDYLEKGGRLVGFDEEDETSDNQFTLTYDKLVSGIKILARSKDYSHHFRDIIGGDADMISADVLLQMSLFGEVKYS